MCTAAAPLIRLGSWATVFPFRFFVAIKPASPFMKCNTNFDNLRPNSITDVTSDLIGPHRRANNPKCGVWKLATGGKIMRPQRGPEGIVIVAFLKRMNGKFFRDKCLRMVQWQKKILKGLRWE
jgi:hypothetical protein